MERFLASEVSCSSSSSSPATMQATRDPPRSDGERAEIQGKTGGDSTEKVGTGVSRRGGEDPEEPGAGSREKTPLSERGAEEEGERAREGGGGDGEEEEEEEEFEFTFACANPEGSPVAADAVFENGKIRPVYPFFDRKLLFADGGGGDGGSSTPPPQLRSPLRKLFVEGRGSASTSSSSSSEEGDELEGVPEGTYCVWRGKSSEEGAEASPEGCRKSNSTGFSKLWRLKELGRRSSSDGKDAFVFLNPRRRGKGEVEKEGRKAASATTSKGGKKGRAAATAEEAHEKHYVMARAAKEGEKRKSYLPYKQVGFFTNVNGMSRNVHPF
ncbi:uncharacterized protein LOC115686267 [Syzygium oleosum]|uniref:uncharacterized protein LOC115686267 n=1 Tax=Syzygium oleosum TaxID=219896 RepID=UPI0024B8E2BC|nr:uncharacterized protein LOC115686267 [Syzygium oleosum]